MERHLPAAYWASSRRYGYIASELLPVFGRFISGESETRVISPVSGGNANVCRFFKSFVRPNYQFGEAVHYVCKSPCFSDLAKAALVEELMVFRSVGPSNVTLYVTRDRPIFISVFLSHDFSSLVPWLSLFRAQFLRMTLEPPSKSGGRVFTEERRCAGCSYTSSGWFKRMTLQVEASNTIHSTLSIASFHLQRHSRDVLNQAIIGSPSDFFAYGSKVIQ